MNNQSNGLREMVSLASQHHKDSIESIQREYPYKIPKGFTPWPKIAALAALIAGSDDASFCDTASLFHAVCWRLWIRDHYPVYTLRHQLMTQFDQTDSENIPSLLSDDWEPSHRMILLLPPQGLLSSEKGSYIPYMFVGLFSSDEEQDIRTEYNRQIVMSAMDSVGTVWYSAAELRDGKMMPSRNDVGSSGQDHEDMAFLNRLRGIALQSLMAIDFLPEELEQAEVATAHGKPHRPRKGIRHLSPRTLGRSKPKRTTVRRSKGGSHRSPIAHWRRGHWRSFAVGQGRASRKMKWVRPTWVNG